MGLVVARGKSSDRRRGSRRAFVSASVDTPLARRHIFSVTAMALPMTGLVFILTFLSVQVINRGDPVAHSVGRSRSSSSTTLIYMSGGSCGRASGPQTNATSSHPTFVVARYAMGSGPSSPLASGPRKAPFSSGFISQLSPMRQRAFLTPPSHIFRSPRHPPP